MKPVAERLIKHFNTRLLNYVAHCEREMNEFKKYKKDEKARIKYEQNKRYVIMRENNKLRWRNTYLEGMLGKYLAQEWINEESN